MSLTRDIQRDIARRELTRSVVRFAHHARALPVAQGVENQAEVDAFLELGVTAGQGNALGRPDSMPAVAPSWADPRLGSNEGETRVGGTAAPRSLAELIRPILELTVRLTDLETAYLTVFDADRDMLEHRFVLNSGALHVPEGLVISWIDSLCKRLRDAGLFWTADVPGDSLSAPLATEVPIRTFVSMPVILSGDRLVGTLCAVGSAARAFDSEVLPELAFFARLLGDRFGDDFAAEPASRSCAQM